tara:strand:- start:12559 stop:15315 length:2757 start_codon:yes stop_codon:yes gene_type:complete
MPKYREAWKGDIIMQSYRLRGAAVTLALALAASCSGGGSDPSPTPTPVADTTPPTITISGDQITEIPFGELYEDEGATATDSRDGEVTVSTSGDVDIFTPGDYDIIYTAQDAAGNTTSATRTVTVGAEQATLTISGFGKASFTLDTDAELTCNDSDLVCSAQVPLGSTVTVAAVTPAGWMFSDWMGCSSVSGNACTVEMTDDMLVFSTAENTVDITYEDDVVFLKDAQVTAIVSFNPTTNSVVFQAGTDLSGINVGSVLVAQSSSIRFLRRVTEIISLTGSATIVKTIPATIDDLVSEGTLVLRPDDPFELIESASPASSLKPTQISGIPEGVTVQYSQKNGLIDISTKLVNVVVYNQNGNTITVSGTYESTFDPQLAMNFTLRDGLQSIRLAGTSNLSASLTTNFSGTLTEIKGEKTLASMNVGTFAVGPLVFVLELEPVIDYSAKTSVSFAPKITLQQSGTLGAQWSNISGWTNLSAFRQNSDVSITDTLSDSVRFEVGFGLKTDLELYDFIGPYLKASASAGAESKLTTSTSCPISLSTYAKLAATVGGEFEFLSRRLKINAVPLAKTWPLGVIPEECANDDEAPSAPGVLTVEAVSASQLSLNWTAATDNVGISQYEVWRQLHGFRRPQRIAMVGGPVTEYLDSGLNAETEYCYFVLAVDAAGNKSAIPDSLTCAFTEKALDTDPPTAPEILSVDAISTTSLEIAWSESTDNEGVAGYVLFDMTEGTENAYIIQSVTELSAIVTQLKAGTEYCYTVAAFDLNGNLSVDSAVECGSTLEPELAEWTAYIGCIDREYLIEESLDLDLELTSTVEVAGEGFDYPGTPLTYVLTGLYSPQSSVLDAEIFWTFENDSRNRLDRFSADLSTGDSGNVVMNQVMVTGCTAQIRFVRNEPEVSKPSFKANPVQASSSALLER